jgi:serine/threonine-protein kinase
VREVAVTAHAHVLEAIDLFTHECVAIQILRERDPAAVATGEPDGRHRFEQEARTLATLRHPNVVPLRAYFPTAHAAVFAWMAGGSLVDWMEREVASPARAVEISCGLLGALGEAHRLRILHGDVKPSNVFFDEIGAARLTGFGASHLSDQSATVTAHASALAALSPEQRLGQATTVASDLYGVGAILIELLTGEPAEPAERGRLVHAPSTRNADLGAAHDAAVAPLLERDPERRPADAFEARRRLEALDWPTRPPPREPRGRAHGSPPHAALSARLGPARSGADGRDAARRQHDAWLDRDVLTLALDDATLATARAFAQADHPSLPCVLRVDPMRREIWVAAPLGRALADEPRALSHGQLARLRDAILALQAIGGAHGSIDLEHLYVHEGDISLAFPRSSVGEAARASDDAAMTAFHQR